MLLHFFVEAYGQVDCHISKRTVQSIAITPLSRSIVTIKKMTESCKLQLVDSLYVYVKRDNDTLALLALNKVSAGSDGSVAEVLDDVVLDLFYKRPSFLLWFCAENADSGLQNNIVLGLSMQESLERQVAKRRIAQFFQKLRTGGMLTAKEMKMLNVIEKEIDPSIWE